MMRIAVTLYKIFHGGWIFARYSARLWPVAGGITVTVYEIMARPGWQSLPSRRLSALPPRVRAFAQAHPRYTGAINTRSEPGTALHPATATARVDEVRSR